jgi:hypothetical protein
MAEVRLTNRPIVHEAALARSAVSGFPRKAAVAARATRLTARRDGKPIGA